MDPTNNPKLFWSYIKRMRGILLPSYPATTKYLNQTNDTGTGISELFFHFFRTAFSEPDPNSISSSFHATVICFLHHVTYSHLKLLECRCSHFLKVIFVKVSRNKSAGPDYFIRYIVNKLCPITCY